MIEARSLQKSFGPVQALLGVSLSVAPGEIVCVFGANGAGKSTLARCLATLARPDGGSVLVDGEEVTSGTSTRLRARLGYVGHRSLLYESFTAAENLAFFAALHGVPAPAERARQLLAEFGLTGRADDTARGLSRGLRQRLSLARALVHSPAVLLLDEPATGLDPAAAAALHERLAAHRARGGCALLVSHDLAGTLSVSDRFVLLKAGRVAAEGPAAGADAAQLVRSHFPAGSAA